MELKRLVIKNFGGIKEADLAPSDIINCVTKEVASAISYVLNNQFAIRHYSSVELQSDSYLFGEMYFYKSGKKFVYTTEIKGFSPPVFTKDGVIMTDDEVDGDIVLSRPYREDNTCIYSVDSKNEFLDYDKFLPSYISRLSTYTESFNACIKNRMFVCNARKGYQCCVDKNRTKVWKRIGGGRIAPVPDLSECDRICANYTVFLLLSEMIDYHQQFISKEKMAIRTPIIVDGLLSRLDNDPTNKIFLLQKTKSIARQVFFVEKEPREVQKVINTII